MVATHFSYGSGALWGILTSLFLDNAFGDEGVHHLRRALTRLPFLRTLKMECMLLVAWRYVWWYVVMSEPLFGVLTVSAGLRFPL
jgi:hypothetical protein